MSDDPTPQEPSEPPHVPPKKGWGCAQWLLVGFLAFGVLVLAGIEPYRGGRLGEKAFHMQAANNARQIIISLKSYASEHEGKYPEGTTANEVLRELIKGGQLEDERVFGCPHSPYIPDNDLGDSPDFPKALQAGENHWVLTKGLKSDSPGEWPIVFENPALPTWPPYWDPRWPSEAKPGRMWKGGKIIVGRNDGSVAAEKLRMDDRPAVTLEPIKDGKNLFELAGPHEVLDLEK